MPARNAFIVLLLLLILHFSCSSPKYLLEKKSYDRQMELKKERAKNIVREVGSSLITTVMAVVLNIEPEYMTKDKQFKKLTLNNPTSDTMFVNMLTDVNWDDSSYCDFMNIQIPPQKKCRLLVPVNANYNLYFSPTPESEDDEKIEFNTRKRKRIKLMPDNKVNLNNKNLNQ